jgi:hypothetical protein
MAGYSDAFAARVLSGEITLFPFLSGQNDSYFRQPICEALVKRTAGAV